MLEDARVEEPAEPEDEGRKTDSPEEVVNADAGDEQGGPLTPEVER
jgi:hypothetical protein